MNVFWRAMLRLPPELAHAVAIIGLRLLALRPLRGLLLRKVHRLERNLEVAAWGMTFPNPVGLAAGFDKDAEVFAGARALGFGFIEVGTVTFHPQEGNTRPRLFRVPEDHALVNRLGFNNRGAPAMAARLLRPRGEMIGVNVGRNRATPNSEAVDNYLRSLALVAKSADYLVLNVSSPNTPDLRKLQELEPLQALICAVKAKLESLGLKRPLLLKVAPDLADRDLLAIADLALEHGIDGLIITNTTITREGLSLSPHRVASMGAGGLSGRPLRQRSVEVLRLLRRHVGRRIALVSVGGIENASDVWERLCAGATLVQLYTAWIYGGPLLVLNILSELRERLQSSGHQKLSDVIGSASA